MTDPNSLVTRFRRRLAAWLHPHPDGGEAWCVDCALNGGRTLVIPADSVRGHMVRHREQNPGASATIEAAWPRTQPDVDGG